MFNSRRTLYYILLALLSSGLLNAYLAFRESSALDYRWGQWLLAAIYGIAFQELIVTRLPIFKPFYRAESKGDIPNSKAAAVLSSLITAGVAALFLFFLGVDGTTIQRIAFVSAVSAGVYSLGRRR